MNYEILYRKLVNEIDCRIEHGADSNQHLEGIMKMTKNREKYHDIEEEAWING